MKARKNHTKYMIVIGMFTDPEEWSKEKSVSYSFGGGWCYGKTDLISGVNAGVAGLNPVSGRSPAGGQDKPLQVHTCTVGHEQKKETKHETFGKRRVTHFISSLMLARGYIRIKT